MNHFGVMQCLIFSAFSTSVITFGMIGLRTEANVVVIAVLNGLFSGSCELELDC